MRLLRLIAPALLVSLGISQSVAYASSDGEEGPDERTEFRAAIRDFTYGTAEICPLSLSVDLRAQMDALQKRYDELMQGYRGTELAFDADIADRDGKTAVAEARSTVRCASPAAEPNSDSDSYAEIMLDTGEAKLALIREKATAMAGYDIPGLSPDTAIQLEPAKEERTRFRSAIRRYFDLSQTLCGQDFPPEHDQLWAELHQDFDAYWGELSDTALNHDARAAVADNWNRWIQMRARVDCAMPEPLSEAELVLDAKRLADTRAILVDVRKAAEKALETL